jgi:hypothetical protein
MRFLRCLSCLLALTMLLSAPCLAAASYSWPVTITQPVAITNAAVPQGASVVITCQGPPSPGADVNVTGTATVPVVKNPSGSFSYTGNVTVSVSPYAAFGLPGTPALSAPPPVSGGVVTCGLYLQVGTTQTPLGSTVSKSLP